MKHKFLKLIFYHHYAWQEKVGNSDIAPFSTIVYMGFLFSINLMSTYSLLSLFCSFIEFVSSYWFVIFILSCIVFLLFVGI